LFWLEKPHNNEKKETVGLVDGVFLKKNQGIRKNWWGFVGKKIGI